MRYNYLEGSSMEDDLIIKAPFQRVGEKAIKPQDKDNQNLADRQKALKDYHDYLVSATSESLQNLGQSDKSISKDLEGKMARKILQVTLSYQDKSGNHLALYEEGDILRLYNGVHFSQIDADALQCEIGLALEDLGIGNAYTIHSDKLITEFILRRLRNTDACKYNPDPSLIAFQNGIYDVSSCQLLPPSPALRPRHIISLPYLEQDCPLWKKTLEEDLEPELIPSLQEALGYVIAGPQLEKMIALVGNGRNGKSTILDTYIGVLGEENVSNFSLSQIIDAGGQKIPPMRNKIANICTDSGAFLGKGDEGTLKAYASGEPLMAKPLYKQPYLTRNYPRSIFALNSLPATSDINDGYFRRFLIIPFTKQIPEDSVDIHLKQKLLKESVGIMYWIIEGAKRVCSQGHFSDSELIRQAQTDYRREADPVAIFLDEKGIIGSDDLRVTIQAAYSVFKAWSIDGGFRLLSKKSFSDRLRALKIKVVKKSGEMCALMGNPFAEDSPF